MDSSSDGAALAVMLVGGLFYLAFIIFFMFCWWRIFSKAGFSGAMSLLFLIPFVNIGVFIYFAFAKWPALENRISPTTFD